MAIRGLLKRNKGLFLVFILFLVVISFMQFRVNEIIGFDGWMNIKMADIIKEEGFIQEFPYTTESILSTSYADLQLLFRIILVPFTFFGLMLGAKIASILFSTLAFTFFYWYLKKNNINYALFWVSLYAVSSVNLMYRFLLPKQMPLAILSLMLTFYFMQKKMYKSLLITSLLFTWLYVVFVFQLLVIGVYFVISLLITKKMDLKVLIYPLAGILLALAVNPYFPGNISLLFTQLFKVNLAANLYNAEWKPWGFLELLKFNYILFGLLIIGLILAIKRMKLDKKSLVFLALSIIFFAGMLKTRRMQEYFAPFTILFAAFSLNDYTAKLNDKKAIKYVFSAILIIIAVFSLISLNTMIKNNHFLPWYKEGAEWLKENVPKGSKVFINGYTFNYLFFYDSELRYTHGVDLTYSYLYDKDKFDRYMGVLQGKDPGYNIIKEDYNADYAFVGKVKQDVKLFEYIVKYGDDFELVYEDESVGILRVKK